MKKLLIIGGLSLILLGTLLGATYAGIYLPKVKTEQEKSMKSAMEIASESPVYAKQQANKFIINEFLDTRTSNLHSHMTLIGVTALVLSFFVSSLQLSDGIKLFAIILLLSSGLLLPLGIFLETWSLKTGSILAVFGGSLFIISIIIFLLGSFRTKTFS